MPNVYSIQTSSGTAGGMLVKTGLLSSLLLGCASAVAFPTDDVANASGYEMREAAYTPSAANQFYFVDALSDLSVLDFKKSVTQFYARLQEDQQSLGTEFEKVLVDNLWDLYSRS